MHTQTVPQRPGAGVALAAGSGVKIKSGPETGLHASASMTTFSTLCFRRAVAECGARRDATLRLNRSRERSSFEEVTTVQ